MLCALCQFDSETSPCTACGNDYCPDCMTWHECEKPSGLYPHQERGLREIEEAVAGGERRICVTSPTGGGKSRMFVERAKKCARQGKKIGIVTHRRPLISQTSRNLEKQGVAHGMMASGYKTAFLRDIQVISVWTLAARLKSGAWNMPDFDEMYWDEAHSLVHETAQFVRGSLYNTVHIGFTATPVGLKGHYDTLIVAGTNSELREIGLLVPCDVYGPDEPDLTRLKQTASGEFVVEEVVKRVLVPETDSRRPRIFGRVEEHIRKINPDLHPMMIFAPDVPSSRWLTEYLTQRGIVTAHIDADTTDEDRQLRFKQLENGDIHAISNRFVLRDGVDLPFVRHCVLACAFGAPSNWLQAVGRVLRASAGKSRATLQDHGGHWHRDGFGSPNSDRTWSLEESDVGIVRRERAKREIEGENHKDPINCPECGAVRKTANACPYCGFVWAKPTRMVIQANGQLKRMSMPKITRKAETPDAVKHWKAAFWAAAARGGKKTFNQIRADWQRRMQTTSYPPFGMQNMPEKGSPDWDRRLVDVYPNVVSSLQQRRKAKQ